MSGQGSMAKVLLGQAALVLCAALAGCAAGCTDRQSDKGAGEPGTASDPAEVIEQESDLGPVKAAVKVSPRKPRLGDAITLVLEVEAEPGVKVEMPSFGEALGRFQIVQFVPREGMQGGKWTASQTYTLQAPMSGKQRIPPLSIEFVDERSGQAQAAGVPAAAGKAQEILTEEIALDVASVMPEGAVASELGEPRDVLSTSSTSRLVTALVIALAVVLVLGIGGVVAVRRWRAERQARRRASAYDVAMTRLAQLEGRGLPQPEEADDWYVELSGIIRRYLEDRYSLRAPELTTEEFLQVARQSGLLSSEHRELLSTFLIGCDRVKFARYAPRDEESMQALDSARVFLQDTRLQEDVAQAARGDA